MSSFKDSLRKAMEEAEKNTDKDTGVVIDVKVTPRGYLIVSSIILAITFLLFVFLGPQTILNSDYKTVIGQFENEDLVYQAGEQQIVQEDTRSWGSSYKKRSRNSEAYSGSRFRYQVISYKKENPSEFVFAFGWHGNLNDPSRPHFHNYLLVGLVFLALLNMLLVRWATSKKAKKFMERKP